MGQLPAGISGGFFLPRVRPEEAAFAGSGPAGDNAAMEILYLLIPIAIGLLALIVALFFWAVKSGQFEDLDSPAWRILMDDEPAPKVGNDGAPGQGAPTDSGQGPDIRR